MGFLDAVGERFRASWALTKLSGRLLMADKEMLFFPIIAALVIFGLFFLILIPSLFAGAIASPSGAGNGLFYGFILWYFVAAFVLVLMQAAIIACVRKRMNGGDPTIGYGIVEAGKRFWRLLGWSLFTTTIGIALRLLASEARQRGGILGFLAKIIIDIIGFAWTIIAMFTVPVIVLEDRSVFGSLTRSAQLVKKTWGEQIIITASVGIFFGFIYRGIFLVLVLSILASILLGVTIWPILVLLALLIAVTALLHLLFEGIFTAVLYSYAAGSNVPREFKDALGTVFTKKMQQGAK